MQVILSLLVLFFMNTVYSQDCDEFVDHPPNENKNILAIGSTWTFTCLPTGGRAFQWFKSGASITFGSVPVGECNCAYNDTALTFRDFQPSDAGNYSCRINRGGGRYFTCNFVVNVPENPTVTLLQNSSRNSEAGQVTFSTVINFGRPRGTFEWLYEDAPLVLNARISIDNNTGTLTISNIQRSDRGRYTIRVMNEHETDSANYDLTVFYLDFPIVNEVFRDNDRVRISCTVTGQWMGTMRIDWNPTPASIGRENPPTVIDNFTRRTSRTADLELSSCVEYECMVSAERAGPANSLVFQPCRPSTMIPSSIVTKKTTLSTSPEQSDTQNTSYFFSGFMVAGVLLMLLIIMCAVTGSILLFIHQKKRKRSLKTNTCHNQNDSINALSSEPSFMTENTAYVLHKVNSTVVMTSSLMKTKEANDSCTPDISGVEGGLMTTNVAYGTRAEPDVSGVEGGLMTTNVSYGTHAEPDISGVEGALMTTNIAYGSHGENLVSGTAAQESGDMTENAECVPIRDGANVRCHNKRGPVLIPNASNNFHRGGLIFGNQENLEAVHETRNVSLSISKDFHQSLVGTLV